MIIESIRLSWPHYYNPYYSMWSTYFANSGIAGVTSRIELYKGTELVRAIDSISDENGDIAKQLYVEADGARILLFNQQQAGAVLNFNSLAGVLQSTTFTFLSGGGEVTGQSVAGVLKVATAPVQVGWQEIMVNLPATTDEEKIAAYALVPPALIPYGASLQYVLDLILNPPQTPFPSAIAAQLGNFANIVKAIWITKDGIEYSWNDKSKFDSLLNTPINIGDAVTFLLSQPGSLIVNGQTFTSDAGLYMVINPWPAPIVPEVFEFAPTPTPTPTYTPTPTPTPTYTPTPTFTPKSGGNLLPVLIGVGALGVVIVIVKAVTKKA